MDWYLILPVFFLALLLLVYAVFRKRKTFQTMRALFPVLLILFILSLCRVLLALGPLSQALWREHINTGLNLLTLFFTMVFCVKLLSFLIFDFLLFSRRHAIKYPRLIRDIVVILLYIAGILLIAKYVFNFQITVVLASSAVLTVVAGFALQDILGDLFSGIALNMEESVQIGDWVRIGNFEGRIEQLRWRSVKIRTVDNELIIIPNKSASREPVGNFGHGAEAVALRSRIGVSYRIHPDLVIHTLVETLKSVDEVAKTPEPQAMPISFGEFSVIYEIRYFITDFFAKSRILGEINRKIWYAFKRENIAIPFPVRDVYIRQETCDNLTTDQIIAILKNNETMSTIDNAQLKKLAAEVQTVTFGQGEILIHEGKTGQFFYHILSGSVEILKNGKRINTLGPNDYFGELALFTGEKTTADVRAIQECRVLRISPDVFRETVTLNRETARKLAEVIAIRRAGLKAFSEQEDSDSRLIINKESEGIFERIRNFFSF